MRAAPASRLPLIEKSAATMVLSGNPLPGRPYAPPCLAAGGYSPAATQWDGVRILLVGAGGIGCEVLHLLAMSGCYSNVVVLDMDTITRTNLNRQFLFREEDIGKWKSRVAARRINERFLSDPAAGGGVQAVVGRLEDQPLDFYRNFDIFFLAVDSVEARRWLNQAVAHLATWGAAPDHSEQRWWWRVLHAPPIVDGGSEGFQGHCRVIRLGIDAEMGAATPCVECSLYLFPAEGADGLQRVPLCTLQSIPRRPEHCVLYAREYLWVQEQRQRHGAAEEAVAFDVDNADHLAFVTRAARQRQEAFGLPPPVITAAFARNVLRRVVPAVSFTNAFIASQAVTEALKLLTGTAPPLRNYSYYNGNAAAGLGVHALVQRLDPPLPSPEPRHACPVCGPVPAVPVALHAPLKEVLRRLRERLGWDPQQPATDVVLSVYPAGPPPRGGEAALAVLPLLRPDRPGAAAAATLADVLRGAGSDMDGLCADWVRGASLLCAGGRRPAGDGDAGGAWWSVALVSSHD